MRMHWTSCWPPGCPDLLVLDWMMPGEDGLSVARRLRAQPGFPPIIMLSAKGEDIDRIIGLEVGADRLGLFADDIVAQLDAFVADEHRGSGDELAHLMLRFPAEAAVEGAFGV